MRIDTLRDLFGEYSVIRPLAGRPRLVVAYYALNTRGRYVIGGRRDRRRVIELGRPTIEPVRTIVYVERVRRSVGVP